MCGLSRHILYLEVHGRHFRYEKHRMSQVRPLIYISKDVETVQKEPGEQDCEALQRVIVSEIEEQLREVQSGLLPPLARVRVRPND